VVDLEGGMMLRLLRELVAKSSMPFFVLQSGADDTRQAFGDGALVAPSLSFWRGC
jgi:hypothetical protein